MQRRHRSNSSYVVGHDPNNDGIEEEEEVDHYGDCGDDDDESLPTTIEGHLIGAWGPADRRPDASSIRTRATPRKRSQEEQIEGLSSMQRRSRRSRRDEDDDDVIGSGGLELSDEDDGEGQIQEGANLLLSGDSRTGTPTDSIASSSSNAMMRTPKRSQSLYQADLQPSQHHPVMMDSDHSLGVLSTKPPISPSSVQSVPSRMMMTTSTPTKRISEHNSSNTKNGQPLSSGRPSPLYRRAPSSTTTTSPLQQRSSSTPIVSSSNAIGSSSPNRGGQLRRSQVGSGNTSTTLTSSTRQLSSDFSRDTQQPSQKDFDVLTRKYGQLQNKVNELTSRVQFVNPTAVQHMWERLLKLEKKNLNTYNRYDDLSGHHRQHHHDDVGPNGASNIGMSSMVKRRMDDDDEDDRTATVTATSSSSSSISSSPAASVIVPTEEEEEEGIGGKGQDADDNNNNNKLCWDETRILALESKCGDLHTLMIQGDGSNANDIEQLKIKQDALQNENDALQKRVLACEQLIAANRVHCVEEVLCIRQRDIPCGIEAHIHDLHNGNDNDQNVLKQEMDQMTKVIDSLQDQLDGACDTVDGHEREIHVLKEEKKLDENLYVTCQVMNDTIIEVVKQQQQERDQRQQQQEQDASNSSNSQKRWEPHVEQLHCDSARLDGLITHLTERVDALEMDHVDDTNDGNGEKDDDSTAPILDPVAEGGTQHHHDDHDDESRDTSVPHNVGVPSNSNEQLLRTVEEMIYNAMDDHLGEYFHTPHDHHDPKDLETVGEEEEERVTIEYHQHLDDAHSIDNVDGIQQQQQQHQDLNRTLLLDDLSYQVGGAEERIDVLQKQVDGLMEVVELLKANHAQFLLRRRKSSSSSRAVLNDRRVVAVAGSQHSSDVSCNSSVLNDAGDDDDGRNNADEKCPCPTVSQRQEEEERRNNVSLDALKSMEEAQRDMLVFESEITFQQLSRHAHMEAESLHAFHRHCTRQEYVLSSCGQGVKKDVLGTLEEQSEVILRSLSDRQDQILITLAHRGKEQAQRLAHDTAHDNDIRKAHQLLHGDEVSERRYIISQWLQEWNSIAAAERLEVVFYGLQHSLAQVASEQRSLTVTHVDGALSTIQQVHQESITASKDHINSVMTTRLLTSEEAIKGFMEDAETTLSQFAEREQKDIMDRLWLLEEYRESFQCDVVSQEQIDRSWIWHLFRSTDPSTIVKTTPSSRSRQRSSIIGSSSFFGPRVSSVNSMHQLGAQDDGEEEEENQELSTMIPSPTERPPVGNSITDSAATPTPTPSSGASSPTPNQAVVMVRRKSRKEKKAPLAAPKNDFESLQRSAIELSEQVVVSSSPPSATEGSSPTSTQRPIVTGTTTSSGSMLVGAGQEGNSFDAHKRMLEAFANKVNEIVQQLQESVSTAQDRISQSVTAAENELQHVSADCADLLASKSAAHEKQILVSLRKQMDDQVQEKKNEVDDCAMNRSKDIIFASKEMQKKVEGVITSETVAAQNGLRVQSALQQEMSRRDFILELEAVIRSCWIEMVFECEEKDVLRREKEARIISTRGGSAVDIRSSTASSPVEDSVRGSPIIVRARAREKKEKKTPLSAPKSDFEGIERSQFIHQQQQEVQQTGGSSVDDGVNESNGAPATQEEHSNLNEGLQPEDGPNMDGDNNDTKEIDGDENDPGTLDQGDREEEHITDAISVALQEAEESIRALTQAQKDSILDLGGTEATRLQDLLSNSIVKLEACANGEIDFVKKESGGVLSGLRDELRALILVELKTQQGSVRDNELKSAMNDWEHAGEARSSKELEGALAAMTVKYNDLVLSIAEHAEREEARLVEAAKALEEKTTGDIVQVVEAACDRGKADVHRMINDGQSQLAESTMDLLASHEGQLWIAFNDKLQGAEGHINSVAFASFSSFSDFFLKTELLPSSEHILESFMTAVSYTQFKESLYAANEMMVIKMELNDSVHSHVRDVVEDKFIPQLRDESIKTIEDVRTAGDLCATNAVMVVRDVAGSAAQESVQAECQGALAALKREEEEIRGRLLDNASLLFDAVVQARIEEVENSLAEFVAEMRRAAETEFASFASQERERSFTSLSPSPRMKDTEMEDATASQERIQEHKHAEAAEASSEVTPMTNKTGSMLQELLRKASLSPSPTTVTAAAQVEEEEKEEGSPVRRSALSLSGTITSPGYSIKKKQHGNNAGADADVSAAEFSSPFEEKHGSSMSPLVRNVPGNATNTTTPSSINHSFKTPITAPSFPKKKNNNKTMTKIMIRCPHCNFRQEVAVSRFKQQRRTVIVPDSASSKRRSVSTPAAVSTTATTTSSHRLHTYSSPTASRSSSASPQRSAVGGNVEVTRRRRDVWGSPPPPQHHPYYSNPHHSQVHYTHPSRSTSASPTPTTTSPSKTTTGSSPSHNHHHGAGAEKFTMDDETIVFMNCDGFMWGYEAGHVTNETEVRWKRQLRNYEDPASALVREGESEEEGWNKTASFVIFSVQCISCAMWIRLRRYTDETDNANDVNADKQKSLLNRHSRSPHGTRNNTTLSGQRDKHRHGAELDTSLYHDDSGVGPIFHYHRKTNHDTSFSSAASSPNYSSCTAEYRRGNRHIATATDQLLGEEEGEHQDVSGEEVIAMMRKMRSSSSSSHDIGEVFDMVCEQEGQECDDSEYDASDYQYNPTEQVEDVKEQDHSSQPRELQPPLASPLTSSSVQPQSAISSYSSSPMPPRWKQAVSSTLTPTQPPTRFDSGDTSRGSPHDHLEPQPKRISMSAASVAPSSAAAVMSERSGDSRRVRSRRTYDIAVREARRVLRENKRQ